MDGITTAPVPLADAGYDTDFYAWSMEQARLIRGLAVPGLDNENVAEEIESLGRSDKRELLSRGTVLLVHLLKWQFQAERRGESWIATIDEQRRGIGAVLDDSPSLTPLAPAYLERAYRPALKEAARETTLPVDTFPCEIPWSASQILHEDWFPE